MVFQDIPSISRISNPLDLIPVLLYTNSSFLKIENLKEILKVHGNKALVEKIIEESVKKSENSRLQSNFERYKLNQDLILQNLNLLKDKNLVFLNLENLVLENTQRTFQKKCVDDFSIQSEVAKMFMNIYQYSPQKLKEELENTVFVRISPFDFMFSFNDEGIYNPFLEYINIINSGLKSKNKRILGSTTRKLNQTYAFPNYAFSINLFSSNFFNEANNDVLDFMLSRYNISRIKNGQKKIELNSYINLQKIALRLNTALLQQKYELIIRTLNLEKNTDKPNNNLLAYMLEGDLGKKILSNITNVRTPGIKLLTNTKMPLRNILEQEAINKLLGFYSAKLKIRPVIMKIEKPILKTLGGENSSQFITLSDSKKIENQLNIDMKLKPNMKTIATKAKKEIKNFGSGYNSIEDVILKLNTENYSILSENGLTTLSLVRKKSRINPYSVVDIKKEKRKLVRPSNSSEKCEFKKFISIIDQRLLPQVSNEYSEVGSLMHKINNEYESNDYKILIEKRIKGIRRKEYCEIPIIHEFKPSEIDFQNTRNYILFLMDKARKRLKTSSDQILRVGSSSDIREFYNLMLKELNYLENEELTIIDGGKPDAVAIIEETNEPIIIDFKRRMKLFYPIESFFIQTVRYGLAVIQQKELNVKKFYVDIVQTPFSTNKFTNNEIFDAEIYRNQVQTIREIEIDSNFVNSVKTNILLEYLGNSIIKKDINIGFLMRDLYKNNTKRPSCQLCFANSQQNYQCRKLLEGTNKPWD